MIIGAPGGGLWPLLSMQVGCSCECLEGGYGCHHHFVCGGGASLAGLQA